MDNVKLLLAYSNHDFGLFSSYPVISRYIEESDVISTIRKEPRSLPSRIVNRFIRIYSASQWYRWTSLELEWNIWKASKTNSYNLIHFLWADRDFGYLDLLKLHNKIPFVATFHCCPEELEKIFIFKNRLKVLSKIIIMSEIQRDFFERCGVEPSKIHFIPHGINTDFFMPSSESQIKDDFTVLSVGSYKRDFTLLRQVAQILEGKKDIKVKVVAPSKVRSYFDGLSNIEFLCGLTDQELLETYQSSSCLLLTVDNSTANNALLEAIACGLPVVAEKIGGIPDYVNSQCALLTEPKDAHMLAKGIIDLYSSPLQYRQKSSAAREKALELSWQKVAQETQKVYESVF